MDTKVVPARRGMLSRIRGRMKRVGSLLALTTVLALVGGVMPASPAHASDYGFNHVWGVQEDPNNFNYFRAPYVGETARILNQLRGPQGPVPAKFLSAAEWWISDVPEGGTSSPLGTTLSLPITAAMEGKYVWVKATWGTNPGATVRNMARKLIQLPWLPARTGQPSMVVSGTTMVGETVTMPYIDFNVTGVTGRYEFFEGNGATPLKTVTWTGRGSGASYQIAPSLVGKQFYGCMVAEKAGYQTMRLCDWADTVQSRPMQINYSAEGGLAQGQTRTARISGMPAGASTVFKLYADGELITPTSTTSSSVSIALTPALRRKYVTVEYTVTALGYTTHTSGRRALGIAQGDVIPAPVVTMENRGAGHRYKVGEIITPSISIPAGGATARHQWSRDGVPISTPRAQNTAIYQVTFDDLDKQLSLSVTFDGTTVEPVTTASTSVRAAMAAPAVEGLTEGEARVGGQFTATHTDVGAGLPSPTWEWRVGTTQAVATSPTYTPTAEHDGNELWLRMTRTGPGMGSFTSEWISVGTIWIQPALPGTIEVTHDSTGLPNDPITVGVPGAPEGSTFDVEWFRNTASGEPLATGVTLASPGGGHRYVARVSVRHADFRTKVLTETIDIGYLTMAAEIGQIDEILIDRTIPTPVVGAPEGTSSDVAYRLTLAGQSPTAWDSAAPLEVGHVGATVEAQATLTHPDYHRLNLPWTEIGVVEANQMGEITAEFDGAPAAGSTLNLVVDGLPDGGHVVTTWRADGVVVGGSGTALAVTDALRGTTITAIYTVLAPTYLAVHRGEPLSAGRVPGFEFGDTFARLAAGSDSPVVGNQLTAEAGDATVDGETVSGWSWTRDGVEVSTSASYRPGYIDSGKQLVVTVALSKRDHETKELTFTVDVPALKTEIGGLVHGDPIVGEELTARLTTPIPGSTAIYTWYVGDSTMPAPATVTGSTPAISTFVVEPAYEGQLLRLVVDVVGVDEETTRIEEINFGRIYLQPGFGEVDLSLDAATGTVGSPVTAALTSEVAADAVTIAWRLGSATGQVVGEGESFTPGSAHAGQTLVAVATLSKPDHREVSVSAAVEVELQTITKIKVAISGRAQVGSKLTAAVSSAPAAASAVVWRRGSTEVGRGSTYTVKAGDVGARLTAVVTLTARGYATGAGQAVSATVIAAPKPKVVAPTVKLAKVKVKAGKKQTVTVAKVRAGSTVTIKVGAKKVAVVKVSGNGKVTVGKVKKFNKAKPKVKAVGRDGFKVTFKVGKKKAKKVVVTAVSGGKIVASKGYRIKK